MAALFLFLLRCIVFVSLVFLFGDNPPLTVLHNSFSAYACERIILSGFWVNVVVVCLFDWHERTLMSALMRRFVVADS